MVTAGATTIRSNASTGSKSVPKVSATSRKSTVRPSIDEKQGKPAPPVPNTLSNPEIGEDHDQLSSLDSFRSASRPGSRDESPPEPKEFVEPPVQRRSPEKGKSSRLSLSDRTIESIQNLPSTPKDRRRSSFFSPVKSPMGLPPRPSSSLSRNGAYGNGRPGTSDGSFVKPLARPSSPAKQLPSSAKPASRTSLSDFGFTPKRSVSSTVKSACLESKDGVLQSPRSTSPAKQSVPAAMPPGLRSLKPPSGSKTTTSRQPKPRPALADAFGPAVRAGTIADDGGEDHNAHSPANMPRGSKRTVSKPSNASSTALRQQIAAAKAAARKDKTKHDSHQEIPTTNGRDFGVETHADPFSQAPKDQKHILRNRINAARMDGKLNIAAMGLNDIPVEVMRMYDADATEESKVSWAEVVDLSKLIAADNDLEELRDAVFPDVSAEDFALDDQTTGNQFGGLEMLDLHNNSLHSLPMGLRRLERLTTLNLAHNKVENSALEVISQIASLKDLKLGHNALLGTLPTSICGLRHLETLELQANRLLGLPESLRKLVSLKVLNVSGNQLTVLPVEALQDLSLIELDASSNALIGSLFPRGDVDGHPTLQTLKVSNNSLAALTFSESLELPQLRTLDVMNNHLAVLPRVSSWTELITLIASDNKIAEFPPGFTTLRKLRNVNFASNGLRVLHPEISSMESLESLILASNPLREKKFLTMSACDIKRDLKSRLEPVPADEHDIIGQEDSHNARDSLSPQTRSPPTSSWSLTSNGTLDLAGRSISDDVNDSLGSFLRSNEVKQLQLSNNKLTAVPPALWLAQDLRTLDLSGNSLSSLYLSEELELPALQDLNLSRCSIATLEPLMTQLLAPSLQTLNISLNRLSGAVPAPRRRYPALTTLLAGDNKYTSVTAESLHGLQTVNLASNNIEHLPAEIGLLWDGGLRSLEIRSNAFRVPNYRILEKGTEATLRYLRDRIPAADSTVVNGD